MPIMVNHDENSISFDFERMLKFIFETYGLSEVVLEDNVELGIMLDGADLMKSLGHVTAGIKLVDHHTQDPITGMCLFVHDLKHNLLDSL